MKVWLQPRGGNPFFGYSSGTSTRTFYVGRLCVRLYRRGAS